MTLPCRRQNRGLSPLRPAEFFGGEFRLFPDLISSGLSGGTSRIDSRVVRQNVRDSFPICFTRRNQRSGRRAITVHIVFHAFYDQVRPQLRLRSNSPIHWPLALHRILYYRLLMSLERRIYRDGQVALSAVSA